MIRLTREPAVDPPCEHCCFCYAVTPFWYTPKDVAVCKACAKTHTPDQVPTKQAWRAAVVAKFPHRFRRLELGDWGDR